MHAWLVVEAVSIDTSGGDSEARQRSSITMNTCRLVVRFKSTRCFRKLLLYYYKDLKLRYYYNIHRPPPIDKNKKTA